MNTRTRGLSVIGVACDMERLHPDYANYVNQGFYRDDWPAREGGKTASLYIDATRVGRSRDEVAQ